MVAAGSGITFHLTLQSPSLKSRLMMLNSPTLEVLVPPSRFICFLFSEKHLAKSSLISVHKHSLIVDDQPFE